MNLEEKIRMVKAMIKQYEEAGDYPDMQQDIWDSFVMMIGMIEVGR